MENESDGNTNCKLVRLQQSTKIDKSSGRFASKRTYRDNPDYSIIEIL